MSVASSEFELEEELEYEDEFEAEEEGEAEFLNTIVRLAQRAAGSAELQEAEYEAEEEAEGEWEAEANPQLRAYPNALMEHLGHMATEAESEDEAEAFIAAAIPLAAQLLPKALPALSKAAPKLIRAAGKVTKLLRRSPKTRKLVNTLPTMLKRTAASVAKQARTGRPVTARTVTRAFQQQARQVLANPARCAHAWRTNRVADRSYHRATGTRLPVTRPVAIRRPAPVSTQVIPRPRPRPRPQPAPAAYGTSGAQPRQCICCGALEYR